VFETATRQNLRPINQMDYVSAGRVAQSLPRVGYLARLYLHFSGTATVALGGGTATLSTKGPWNTWSRIRVLANQGTDIFNVSGYGAYLLELISMYRRDPQRSPDLAAAYAGAYLFGAAVASGANVWEFGLGIPIVPNERDMAGILLLQSEMLTTQLVLEYATAYGLVSQDFPVVTTGAATVTLVGTSYPELEIFTVPAAPGDQPPLTTLHQTLELVQPIAATGDQVVNLLRANTYMKLIHVVELNGALDTVDVGRLQFRYNNSETPYDLSLRHQLQLQRRRYGTDLPVGSFVWDFFNQGLTNFGGGRDFVDGSSVAELQSIVSINTGATLGSGNNQLRTISEQLVNLGAPQAV
jgi:hypothetical protein